MQVDDRRAVRISDLLVIQNMPVAHVQTSAVEAFETRIWHARRLSRHRSRGKDPSARPAAHTTVMGAFHPSSASARVSPSSAAASAARSSTPTCRVKVPVNHGK